MSSSSISDIISIENKAFRSYAFWTAVLILKMLTMSILTARQRFRKKVFANPEDLKCGALKPTYDDPDVERVRRAHRNDLENILPFCVISFFYLWTSPNTFIAVHIFRIFGVSRIVHTLAYTVFIWPHRIRAISWFIGFIATWFMAANTVLYFL